MRQALVTDPMPGYSVYMPVNGNANQVTIQSVTVSYNNYFGSKSATAKTSPAEISSTLDNDAPPRGPPLPVGSRPFHKSPELEFQDNSYDPSPDRVSVAPVREAPVPAQVMIE